MGVLTSRTSPVLPRGAVLILLFLLLGGTVGTRSQTVATVPLKGELAGSGAELGLRVRMETTMEPSIIVAPLEGSPGACAPLTPQQDRDLKTFGPGLSQRHIPVHTLARDQVEAFIPPGNQIVFMGISVTCPCKGACTCPNCVDPTLHYLRVKETQPVRYWSRVLQSEVRCLRRGPTRAHMTLNLPLGGLLWRQGLRIGQPPLGPPPSCYPASPGASTAPASPGMVPADGQAIEIGLTEEGAGRWVTDPFTCPEEQVVQFETAVVGPCPDAKACSAPDELRMTTTLDV